MKAAETVQASPAAARRGFAVIVADRSEHFRETIRRVLSEHALAEVTAEAATLVDAVRLVRRLRPDVVLLDIDLVLSQSPDRLRRLAHTFPHLRVIVMLNEASDEYRSAVAERWGYACIVKDQAETALELLAGRAKPLTALRPQTLQ